MQTKKLHVKENNEVVLYRNLSNTVPTIQKKKKQAVLIYIYNAYLSMGNYISINIYIYIYL